MPIFGKLFGKSNESKEEPVKPAQDTQELKVPEYTRNVLQEEATSLLREFETRENEKAKAEQETNSYLDQIISELRSLGFNNEDVDKINSETEELINKHRNLGLPEKEIREELKEFYGWVFDEEQAKQKKNEFDTKREQSTAEYFLNARMKELEGLGFSQESISKIRKKCQQIINEGKGYNRQDQSIILEISSELYWMKDPDKVKAKKEEEISPEDVSRRELVKLREQGFPEEVIKEFEQRDMSYIKTHKGIASDAEIKNRLQEAYERVKQNKKIYTFSPEEYLSDIATSLMEKLPEAEVEKFITAKKSKIQNLKEKKYTNWQINNEIRNSADDLISFLEKRRNASAAEEKNGRTV